MGLLVLSAAEVRRRAQGALEAGARDLEGVATGHEALEQELALLVGLQFEVLPDVLAIN